jgi:hypothetical protein
MRLVTPYHYRIYECSGSRWFVFDAARVFYNSTNRPINLVDVEQEFGLTSQQVVIELFRINGGTAGYYLANLKDKKYYYCGLDWEDVKRQLLTLGIGREEPQ